MAPGREFGSWLTMSKKGRIGILTNVLVAKPKPDGLARGKLVTEFAAGTVSPEKYFQELPLDQFNEFNLSLIDLMGAHGSWMTSSASTSQTDLAENVKYVMSNSRELNSEWPKAAKLRHNFDELDLDRPKDELVEKILEMLEDGETCGESALIAEQSCGFVEKAIGMKTYNSVKITGLKKCLMKNEAKLKCVSGDVRYGTRTHSVIVVDELNRVTFVEVDRRADGEWIRRREEFTIQ